MNSVQTIYSTKYQLTVQGNTLEEGITGMYHVGELLHVKKRKVESFGTVFYYLVVLIDKFLNQ